MDADYPLKWVNFACRLTGLDLIAELRGRLKAWWEKREKGDTFHKCRLALVFICPKTREGETKIESSDIWVFLTESIIEAIGMKLGIWDLKGGYICPLIPGDNTKKGENELIFLLNPSFHLTREMASNLNGFSEIIDPKIVAIGTGGLRISGST